MRIVFDLLKRIQLRCQVQLLLIGGWAVQAHGYARNTLDVDCLIATESDPMVTEELKDAGFLCFDETTSFRRFQHRIDPMIHLDVMRVNTATFEKMWLGSQSYTISGVELRVPALSHLIALKLHAAQNEHRAEKDLADIHALLRANPGQITAAELKQICDKFGTPLTTERLADFL